MRLMAYVKLPVRDSMKNRTASPKAMLKTSDDHAWQQYSLTLAGLLLVILVNLGNAGAAHRMLVSSDISQEI